MVIKYAGYMSNQFDNESRYIESALNGRFEDGFTVMPIYELEEEVVGLSPVMTVNLRELIKYVDKLKEGYRIDVYMTWYLNNGEQEEVKVDIVDCVKV